MSQQFPQYQPQTIVVQAPRQSQALPALASFCLPGLGQLIQGRVLAGMAWFGANLISLALIFAGVGLITTPILWLVCIMDAAKYRG
jgi:TM2 domain-containing membrane protein YozV